MAASREKKKVVRMRANQPPPYFENFMKSHKMEGWDVEDTIQRRLHKHHATFKMNRSRRWWKISFRNEHDYTLFVLKFSVSPI